MQQAEEAKKGNRGTQRQPIKPRVSTAARPPAVNDEREMEVAFEALCGAMKEMEARLESIDRRLEHMVATIDSVLDPETKARLRA